MKRILLTCVFIANLWPAISPAENIAQGRQKAAQCASCHGIKGISKIQMYPNLAGQKAQYIIKQLKEFKSGYRKDPIMQPLVMHLSEKDIAEIAGYYASIK